MAALGTWAASNEGERHCWNRNTEKTLGLRALTSGQYGRLSHRNL